MMKRLFAKMRAKEAFICDMDGVIYHGDKILPGAIEFVNWLKSERKKFMFLTNNSDRMPKKVRAKLGSMGIDVDESHIYTCALATADFLNSQKPRGTAFVIGGEGVKSALRDIGYTISNSNPDYVVISESEDYTFKTIRDAVRHVRNGARLVGTNPDITGLWADGIFPATGALMMPIEKATKCKAYYVGKPNPLMACYALNKMGVCREETVIIGDSMDIDIKFGIKSKISTILVLSGLTSKNDIAKFAYSPDCVLEEIGDLLNID